MQDLSRQVVNKAKLPIKVVQFGSGNFLRGFADYIIDALNDDGYQAGIAVVKNRPGLSMLDLQQQDGIFTLFTEGIKDGEVFSDQRVISAISTVVNPYDDYTEYLNLATEPALKLIVSNTTEAGIYFDPADSALDNTPHQCFAAKLTALLHKRYIWCNGATDKGLYILPCELIENNGTVLRDLVLQYATLWHLGEDFHSWVAQHSKFYNTLVDRIVSGYPKENEMQYRAKLDYSDKLITICEPYLFWGIEGDASLATHFPFRQFGDQIALVDDLSPYRIRKVRILNGAHTLMAQIGRLRDLETVGQCMEDSFTRHFITHAIEREILPTIALPKEALQQYTDEVIDRFKNPFLRHYLADIAQNTILKFKTRLLPTIIDYIEIHTAYPKHLLFALAALIHLSTQNENSVADSGSTNSEKNYEDIVSCFILEHDFSGRRLEQNNFLTPLAHALMLIGTVGLQDGYQRFCR
ncbi:MULTISPECIES: tagaturonate reductase [Sphingobacterium]|uniref:Tagaturonate reductase n=1 Tax=Sphingobacterium populi TaxID=1812824 RepID=A0ABW5UD07_9SPHI|nr:tagaturonate reductase [Sphingobacterium sp. CFCC 11742]